MIEDASEFIIHSRLYSLFMRLEKVVVQSELHNRFVFHRDPKLHLQFFYTTFVYFYFIQLRHIVHIIVSSASRRTDNTYI